MREQSHQVTIIGAGIGGLAAAATLRRIGMDVQVYEQAAAFMRVGAGIQVSPNAMKVLRALGLEDELVATAYTPDRLRSRDWNTGRVTNELPLGDTVAARYGAPYLFMHRAELHAALASIVPDEIIHRGKRLVALEQRGDRITAAFEDGTAAEADALIGADGVHSTVRELLFGREEARFGREEARFTGRVAYRTTFPAELLGGQEIGNCTKWWGPDRHIVIYFVTKARDDVYFVTSTPEALPSRESWSALGDLDELRAAYEGFHPEVRAVLRACPQVHKWALFDRDPLPSWTKGRAVLLGDSCHPMTPYMAQGAAMAIEDAVVLSRCLDGASDVTDAFRRFEATRKDRTSRVQASSRANTWLQRRTDTDWVFAYDAWQAPLAESVTR